MFSSEMLPQVGGNKLIQLQFQLSLKERFFILLESLCYGMQLRLEEYSLEITDTEMLYQAMFVNILILKAYFYLFWMPASLSCTHGSALANHFIFGTGSMNILCMLTDDYDNLFYKILPRDYVQYLEIALLCSITTFSNIYLYFSEYYQVNLRNSRNKPFS